MREDNGNAPMKIVHVNTNSAAGGAATVMSRLAGMQRAAGDQVSFVVGLDDSGDPDVHRFPFQRNSLRDHIDRRVRRYFNLLEAVSGNQYSFQPRIGALKRMEVIHGADVVHVHNTHGGYIHPAAIPQLSRSKPVVWTLHDQWTFTGHCACFVECDRWRDGCGNCPDLNLYPSILWDNTRVLWRRKRNAYRNARFTLTVPSRWMEGLLADSMLSHLPVQYVPNGVDPDVFRPSDRAAARAALGIPPDRFVVLFAANIGSNNPWKGFNYLCEALDRVAAARPADDLYLLVIGNKSGFGDFPFESRWEGSVQSEHVMAAYYNSADLFILPSIAENSPLTVIESLACATPVVAFDVGGVRELVAHRENGYLARYKDAEDLANGVLWVRGLDTASRQQLGERGAAFVRSRHTLRHQRVEFDNIYRELLPEGVREA